jgi:hypothetical protein
VEHCLDIGCLREREGIPSGERHDRRFHAIECDYTGGLPWRRHS